MKKSILTILALAVTVSLGAQTVKEMKEDILSSEKRAEQLQKLVGGMQNDCGVEEINQFATSIKAAAVCAIDNSVKLSELYYRETGEAKEGVTEVLEKKPTAEEWVSLGTSVAGEGGLIAAAEKNAEAAAKKIKELSEDAKNGNPMQKAKKAKQLKAVTDIVANGKDALAIILEESVAQGKAIKQIIEIVNSAKNL